MNIFLPYENNIEKSVIALDDTRLNKQIIECLTMFNAITTHKQTGEKKGYFSHPVTQFYYDNPEFIIYYGYICCLEYEYRQNKQHESYNKISSYVRDKSKQPKYIPYYMEGAKTDPNHIRTTENVSKLFQQKLFNKWKNDKRKPCWTKRNIPEFYI